jgi:AcrR family transcriptional regulator
VSERRDEILKIAKRLFAERGYADTSMRDIAQATGVLAGSLYAHFRSKAQLVGEIVLAFYDELIPVQEEALAADGTGAERLAEMLERVLVVCAAHRDELTILHYDWQSLSTIDELKDIQDRSTQTLNLWQAVVAEGIADGSVKATVNPDLMMRVITSSIHGVLDPIRYRGRSRGRAANAHDLAAFLQLVMLDGVASDTPRPKKNGSRPTGPAKVVSSSPARRQS